MRVECRSSSTKWLERIGAKRRLRHQCCSWHPHESASRAHCYHVLRGLLRYGVDQTAPTVRTHSHRRHYCWRIDWHLLQSPQSRLHRRPGNCGHASDGRASGRESGERNCRGWNRLCASPMLPETGDFPAALLACARTVLSFDFCALTPLPRHC